MACFDGAGSAGKQGEKLTPQAIGAAIGAVLFAANVPLGILNLVTLTVVPALARIGIGPFGGTKRSSDAQQFRRRHTTAVNVYVHHDHEVVHITSDGKGLRAIADLHSPGSDRKQGWQIIRYLKVILLPHLNLAVGWSQWSDDAGGGVGRVSFAKLVHAIHIGA